MFRKIVSNLPFSPALVGQLSFYAKRLRKEELTRRFGLMFTALALVVQSFAVFQAPEAANASSPADFIPGGISSKSNFLYYYDRNHNNIRDLFNSLGITRAEVGATTERSIPEVSTKYNWSMTSLYSYSQGQRSYTFPTSSGSKRTVYNRPFTLTMGGPYHTVFEGKSTKFGYFAIKKDCGNLVTTKQPPSPPPPSTACTSLRATMIDRTRVRLDATGSVTGGATISSYRFSIKNASGTVIASPSVTTTATTASYTYTQDKPGAYSASVTIRTSLGDKTSSSCMTQFVIGDLPPPPPPPSTAVCSALKAEVIGRTNVELQASATVSNATISKYTFTVRDSSGTVISTQEVRTSSSTARTDAILINKPGEYSAKVVVSTSLGDKTSQDCMATFRIVEPEKCPYNSNLLATDERCQGCPDSPSIWIESPDCKADIIQKKMAINLDRSSQPASNVLALSSNRISYTISVENRGNTSITVPLVEDLTDVLEYASLVDLGGGTFKEVGRIKTLTWSEVELKPGDKQIRTFVVRLEKTIPATNTGTSNAASFDCKMTNTFGNSVEINVDCPIEKVVVEQIVSELPHTGPAENMVFSISLLMIVTYFYARSLQTGKEVRLIRRDLNAGTI